VRNRHLSTILAALLTGCQGAAVQPSAQVVISNLKSNVLGTELAVCGRGAGLSLTQFTFDFAVQGSLDIGTGTSVYRLPATGSSGAVPLAQIAPCSTGPCTVPRRACVTAGRSNGSGTIEFSATEEYRSESTWRIELRQDGQASAASNALTVVVSYPPQ
jgi:hypothetical protein